MMSVETIRNMQREATERAAKQNSVPFIVEREDLADWTKGNWRFPFPFLGNYVPQGWKMIDRYFVDSSGFGTDGEGALSIRQFLGKLKPGYGYAVVEAGQFQVYIGEYEKIKEVKENAGFVDAYGRRKP